MRFLRFLIGGFLILGSIIFGIMLLIGTIPAIIGGAGWVIVFWGVIDFIAFLGGIYIVIHH